MTAFMGYSRSIPSETGRPVQILSVDGSARQAIGRTREGSDVEIDCRYMVGGALITPAVGEVWWVERFDAYYTLRWRFPANPSGRALPVGHEGQTQIGSSGPTEIVGSVVNVLAGPTVEADAVIGTDLTVGNEITLGGVRYRDGDGTLQRQNPETQEWLAVSPPPIHIRFTAEMWRWPMATVAPTFSDRCYAPTRQLVGAYLRASSAPAGSDLVAEIQYSPSPGDTWSTLATLTITDGTTTEASATLDHDQVEGDYLRVEFTSVGSGTPATGVVVDILVR